MFCLVQPTCSASQRTLRPCLASSSLMSFPICGASCMALSLKFENKKSVEFISCLNPRGSTPYTSNKYSTPYHVRHLQLVLDVCPARNGDLLELFGIQGQQQVLSANMFVFVCLFLPSGYFCSTNSLLLFPIQIRMSSGIGHCKGKGFLVFFPNEKPVGL